MRARVAAFVLLAAAALAPSPASGQRDTLRLGARDTLAPADTAVAPARDPRWATPFAVQASGQVAPLRAPRDVVWLDADSVRARRRAARLAAAAADSAAEDSAAAEPPADTAAAPDTAEAPPPRRTRRAAADSAASTRRAGSRTAARDTASDTPTRRSASADTAGRASTGTRRPRTHRVAGGETLFAIARRYGVTTAQLRALNPELVVGNLETGTVLRLPAGARAPAADTARAEGRRRTTEAAEPTPRRPAAETRPSTRGRRSHTVAPRETLYGIARRYGVTVDAIKAANRLTGDALRTGQTLVIPAAPPR